MNRLSTVIFFVLITLFIHSCSQIPDKHWTKAVPEKIPFVISPAENTTVNSLLESSYIPFFDDITSSAVQLISNIDTSAASSLPLNAVMLYPGASDQLHPVWIATAPPNYDKKLEKIFRKPYTQNQYYFNGIVIRKLHIRERSLFAAQLNNYLLVSESSLGIEDAIRSYLSKLPSIDLSEIEILPSSIIMNTPSLGKWAEQLGKTIYRPALKNSFDGTKPVLLTIENEESENFNSQSLSGSISMADSPKSNLVSAFSEVNAPIQLDRYISSNAAGFILFRLTPRLAPPVSIPDTSRLDSVLIEDRIRYSKFAKSMDSPFALVLYAESGFLSTGEHLILRKLKDRPVFEQQLNQLVEDGLIEQPEDIYHIQSQVLAQLIGSELNSFSDFYLDLTGDVVVISKRKGLTEAIASDRSRRRVIYYEQGYADIKETLPEEVSGLVFTNPDIQSFITPFLKTGTYIDVLLSRFDLMAISTRMNSQNQTIDFDLTTYETEQQHQPYEEKWLLPTGGAQLTGKPVRADMGGSAREEIIFATKSGTVYALASDGTVILQVSTGENVPVGSPVVFDWYGTGQNVIFIAAGNKIYGWNDTGTLLPKFPFELPESITTPLVINDIDRNGLPEVILATADRKLHALNGRGENIEGWPLTTNAVIDTPPLIDMFEGAYSVIAFSENAVHAWKADGTPLNNFPKFINATLMGSPVLDRGNILAGAADGYLYSIGRNEVFADSLNIYSATSDSTEIQAIYVSNTSLVGSPSINEVSVRTETDTYSGEMILTMSKNGSVFLISKDGELLFTKNMGQPSAQNSSPFILDLDNNQTRDIIALADFGRLYAWEIASGERIYSIPTTGMQHVIIEDIDGDSYQEVIAQTSEGVRCWTIYGAKEEESEEAEPEEE